MTHVVEVPSPGAAWIQAVELVFRRGNKTTDNGKILKEVLNVVMTISKSSQEDKTVKKFGDPEMISWMKKNFLGIDPIPDWGYSYGSRIKNFGGIDQLSTVIKKLQKNPESKSATLGFLYPPGDEHHVPCITTLDLKIRRNKLCGAAFMRSQDAVKKLYADIISLGEVMSLVARDISVPVGPLTLFVASLHIYEPDFGRGRQLISKSKLK